jgi:hypothetical protein
MTAARADEFCGLPRRDLVLPSFPAALRLVSISALAETGDVSTLLCNAVGFVSTGISGNT